MSINISDEDVAQVSMLCPDADEDYIRHNLSITGDVNTTINSILDGNVNRLQNTDFDSDEELPQLSLKPCKQPKNIALVLDSNEPGFVSSINQGKDCSKQARKIPYSKNDFLSDSSDNDVEMVETLSLKERLLGKQSTFTYKEFTGNLIGTSIKCDQHDQQKENLKNMHSKNVIEIIECCDMDDEISNENFGNNSDQDYSQTSSTSNTIECVNKNKSLDLNLHVPGLEKSDKPIKRKRTTEEIEDRKRQAQLKKEFAEQKKLEREKAQLEKKKNVQIRKIQGERKKQMGAWNQSLECLLLSRGTILSVFTREMEHLDILSFDPLNPQLADTYVQSVLTPVNVSKVTTTAEIHPGKTVSNVNSTSDKTPSRNKRRLSNGSVEGTSKKLKFLVNDDHDDIIRLTQSTQCKDNSICTNEHNSSDFSELKSLVFVR
ncbi:unnamed protein product [Mytilus edulis]|uniref:CUE domain-containing protein n=1 Tax=Mytilus edulis TaxID=6550 RepID=A0A8S3QI25_MYTED|nr:unnamed protein product [Mytilus edulis]